MQYKPESSIARFLHSLTHRYCDINQYDGAGRTQLIQAVYDRDSKKVERLLKDKHIDVNKLSKDKESALIRAAEFGLEEMTQMLLEHPNTNVNRSGYCKATALQRAVEYGQERIVKMLLDHPKVNVNQKGWNGKTIIMYLLSGATLLHDTIITDETRASIACRLIRAGATINNDLYELLSALAKYGNDQELQQLVQSKQSQIQQQHEELPPYRPNEIERAIYCPLIALE